MMTVVTECSDKVFHFTRVSLFSFIQHNSWFNGKVVILSSAEDPLSVNNFNIIRAIYSNSELIEVHDHEMDEVMTVIKNKSVQPLDSILSVLFFYCFKLDVSDIFYFANTVIFLR